jgi:15-cis-phytoene synthase
MTSPHTPGPQTPDPQAGPLDLARQLGSLYSSPTERPVLEALFALESEISASLQSGLDHNVAHVRLQWWREELDRLAKGIPAHPLTRTLLTEFAGTSAEALTGLSGFVDVAVWDLAAATFETRRELTAYCERWAAAMMVTASAHASGQPNDARSWLTLGAAVHELEMLANLAIEVPAGRLRLPLDELERAGVDPESLSVTPSSPPLAALIGGRHEALRSILAATIAQMERSTQPALRGLLVWVALTWRHSRYVQKALPDVYAPGRFDGLATAWHAWRAARHAVKGTMRIST